MVVVVNDGDKILLADDHHIVRRGLRQVLEHEADFSIVGEGENGRQICDLLEEGVEADVLLTDLSMPVMDGIQLTSTLRGKYPHLKVVLLTIQEDRSFVKQAFQAGVKSYMFKSADPYELSYAVRQVANGKAYLCSDLSGHLINHITAWEQERAPYFTDIKFSDRELDVLRLIADGFTNEETADKLFMSRRTVEGHRQAMIDKTGSRNSLALVRFGVKHGFIK